MPPASGALVEFRDSGTKALMFTAKMHAPPRVGETVRHEGTDHDVTQVGYILTPDPRMTFCGTRIVTLLTPA
jgi:hypothetical protein